MASPLRVINAFRKRAVWDYSPYLITAKAAGREFNWLEIPEFGSPPEIGDKISANGQVFAVEEVNTPGDIAKGRGGPIASSMRRRGIGWRVKLAYEFSSLQCNLPDEIAEEIFEWGLRNIPDQNMAADGRQPRDDIHVTVKYGIHITDPMVVRELLINQKPIKMKLGKVSLFESDDYDVVKLGVTSTQLHQLNKTISNNLEVTDTFPDYNPHVTIAYVKKGLGRLYDGRDDFEGRDIILDNATFSGKDNRKTVLQFP